MSVFIFFQGFLPTLLPLVGAVAFAGIAALKRKEIAIWVLFLSLVLVLVGVVSVRLAIVSAASAQVTGVPLSERASFITAAHNLGNAMPVPAGIVAFIGWMMLALKKPNQSPEPMPLKRHGLS